MQPSRLVALTGLTALTLVGCSDQSSTTEGTAPEVSQNFTNGPASPGPNVFRVREPDWFVFLFPDFRADLIASVGLEGRFSLFCEPALPPIPPQDLQFLFNPKGRVALLLMAREMPVLIYAGAFVGTAEEFCAHLATAPIVATGTAHVVFNHHDLTSDAANGYRAQGVVDLVAGGQAHFSGVVKFVSTPDGGTRVVVSQVNLSPRGGGM